MNVTPVSVWSRWMGELLDLRRAFTASLLPLRTNSTAASVATKERLFAALGERVTSVRPGKARLGASSLKLPVCTASRRWACVVLVEAKRVGKRSEK